MTINYATGEITEPGTALAPVSKDEASVVGMLERAKSWLSNAVDAEDIAVAKAQLRTAETYAKELQLSKDIQLDAAEMVRRAEYALGKAIRQGQAEGTVLRQGEVKTAGFGEDRGPTRNFGKASPTDYAAQHELTGVHGDAGIYAIVDAAPEPEEFEKALAEAREEGNLSRANVGRKVKKQTSTHQTRDQRADLIADLAAQGYSSRQMPAKVGVAEESVRQIARDYDIEIPADRAIRKTRRINSTEVAAKTVTALEGLVMGVELIDYDAIDPRDASQWAESLTDSLRVLNRFARQIKETAQ